MRRVPKSRLGAQITTSKPSLLHDPLPTVGSTFRIRRVPAIGNPNHGSEIAEFRKRISQTPARTKSNESYDGFERHALMYVNTLSASEIPKVLRYMASSESVPDKEVIARYSERMHLSGLERFSPRDVALAMNSLVRLKYYDLATFTLFAQYFKTLAISSSISHKDLGSVCNAFCRAGLRDDSLFDILCTYTDGQMSTITSRSGGNICHAIGKLKINTPITVDTVLAIARRVVDNEALPQSAASPQELSNVVYSLGNLEINDTSVLPYLLDIVHRRMSEFNPMEVSAIATALSKLHHSDKELMKCLSKHVQSTHSAFGVFEITAVLNAFSHLQVPVPRALFNIVGPAIITNSLDQPIDPTSACILICAYARCKLAMPVSIREALRTATLRQSDPQYLVNVLFALGQSEDLPILIAEAVVLQLNDLIAMIPDECVTVTQLIYAFNKLNLKSAEHNLYKRSLDTAKRRAAEFDGSQICNIIHSIVYRQTPASIEELDLITLLEKSPRLTNLTPQLHASLAEALTVISLPK